MPFHLNRRFLGLIMLAAAYSAPVTTTGLASGSAESSARVSRWVTIVDLLRKPSQHLKENKPALRLASGKRLTFTLMPWGPELGGALADIDTYLARHESTRLLLAEVKPHISGVYIADFVVRESEGRRRYTDEIGAYTYYDADTLAGTGGYVIFINSLLLLRYVMPCANPPAASAPDGAVTIFSESEYRQRLVDAVHAGLNAVQRDIEAKRRAEVAITVEEDESEEAGEAEPSRHAVQSRIVASALLHYCTII